jgi:hypothetical protein
MNVSACRRLSLAPVTGIWYRTVELRYLETALSSSHTSDNPTRFCGGTGADFPFEILYLCENTLVAQFEVGALLGSPWELGGVVTRPGRSWADVSVSVRLQFVADLTLPPEQTLLETTVQELTGDWQGYHRRKPDSPVREPVGRAPTQDLGEALYNVPQLEGFLSVSAKVPSHRNLNVFPEKLQKGSQLIFEYPERGLRVEVSPAAHRRRPRR